MEGLAEALIPGRYWVDFIPLLKYVPSWMPGAKFQRVASRYKPFIVAMKEAPYQAAHDAWVSSI